MNEGSVIPKVRGYRVGGMMDVEAGKFQVKPGVWIDAVRFKIEDKETNASFILSMEEVGKLIGILCDHVDDYISENPSDEKKP